MCHILYTLELPTGFQLLKLVDFDQSVNRLQRKPFLAILTAYNNGPCLLHNQVKCIQVFQNNLGTLLRYS